MLIDPVQGMKSNSRPSGSPIVRGDEFAIVLFEESNATVDFVFTADTRISGRVIDHNGSPAHACLMLESVEDADSRNASFFACSRPDGTFQMELMAPGQYIIFARDDVSIDGMKSTGTFYGPGTRDRQKAQVITVAAAKSAEGIEIRRPSNETRRVIEGRVVYRDGVAAEQVGLVFHSDLLSYMETSGTDAEGKFKFTVLDGVRGTLTAEKAMLAPARLKTCPEFQVTRERGMFIYSATPPLEIKSDSDHRDLTFVLPFDSCKPQ